MTEQTPQDAYVESCLIDLSKQLTAAEKRNKELEAALYAIQSYDRDTLCYDASDVAAMRDIAFAALSGEKKDVD